ncbi:MAG: hypothetical protein K9M45_03525 [Kiritimatiellales bacterium]|nr:hypothetical protein [Kiritimatiellales bacterium]
MNKKLGLMMIFVLAAGIAIDAGEKKNAPKTSDVEDALKAAGPEHFPEKMKVGKVGSVEAGETYYHAYCGEMKKAGYRVIFMDNSGKYLGYYPTEYEPSDYEEGAILLNSGSSDDEGNTDYFTLPVGKDGPADKVRIDGTPVTFVKNPKNDPKAAKATTPKATGSITTTVVASVPVKPEYREWTITHGGKKIPVRAIYVKMAVGKVFLKAEANGATRPFDLSSLSKEDQSYVKQFE